MLQFCGISVHSMIHVVLLLPFSACLHLTNSHLQDQCCMTEKLLKVNNFCFCVSTVLHCSHGWVQIHLLESNTNTTHPNHVQIHCFSRFQYNYKFPIQIQIHCLFLIKIHCHFLTFDLNMIQILAHVFITVQVYHSG